ncbi:MAG: hypothetical protein QOJ20_3062 [Mycobacterium sp.]|jgi:hypothetical protein|nr:hypothetical protein [Mycobacterium sp.]
MTSARVLATEDAKTAAVQMVGDAGHLHDQIGKVVVEGDKLADPNQWDGKLAQQWRGDWTNDKKQLQDAASKLDDLQKKAQKAVQDILHAGGDA